VSFIAMPRCSSLFVLKDVFQEIKSGSVKEIFYHTEAGFNRLPLKPYVHKRKTHSLLLIANGCSRQLRP
jgi:hypothetical protein